MYKAIIADDEKWICNAIVSILNTAVPGVGPIEVFQNGARAYEHVKENGGDILLLDIQMPGKSGLDIAQLVADRGDDCFVVIITAYQDFEYAKRAINCNVGAFLTKPFSSQQLVEAVHKGIDQLEKRKKRLESRHRSNRSLLQAICVGRGPAVYSDVRLCDGTVPMGELLCTEIVIRDAGLAMLPAESMDALEKVLLSLAEKDQEDASVFLMECRKKVKLLAFSREAPPEDAFASLGGVVSRYTGNTAEVQMKTWESFSRYRSSLDLASETEKFFQQVLDGNYKSARKHIAQYVSSLSEADRGGFAAYLEESHGTACGTDPEGILQCLDTLSQQILAPKSCNLIVAAACEYISENLGSSTLSLNTTAEALFISRAHLSRLLKKYTGYTFSVYLQKTRMEHAKKLLETTNLSTAEIAAASGYETAAYFRTAFKAHFHMTPRQYRLSICGKERSEL